jgi:hypothetical protein
MTDPDPAKELAALASAHLTSVEAMISLRERLDIGENVALEYTIASHSELWTRKRLLNWQAPTPGLAQAKLVHVLTHALLTQIPYDEESLRIIRAEHTRFQDETTDPQKDSG